MISIFVFVSAGFDQKSDQCSGSLLCGQYGWLGRVASPALCADSGRAPTTGNRARTRQPNAASQVYRSVALQKCRLTQPPHSLVQGWREFADESSDQRVGAGNAAD